MRFGTKAYHLMRREHREVDHRLPWRIRILDRQLDPIRFQLKLTIRQACPVVRSLDVLNVFAMIPHAREPFKLRVRNTSGDNITSDATGIGDPDFLHPMVPCANGSSKRHS